MKPDTCYLINALLPAKPGAVDRDRTCDLLVTSELLYQLSYNGTLIIIANSAPVAYPYKIC